MPSAVVRRNNATEIFSRQHNNTRSEISDKTQLKHNIFLLFSLDEHRRGSCSSLHRVNSTVDIIGAVRR